MTNKPEQQAAAKRAFELFAEAYGRAWAPKAEACTKATTPNADEIAPAVQFASARKPGRPLASEAHLTAEATKPWEAAGMSRRTWYRRKRDSGDG